MMNKRTFVFIFVLVLFGVVSNFPLAWVGRFLVPDKVNFMPSFHGTIWKGLIADIPDIGVIETRLSLRNAVTGKPPLFFKSNAPYLKFAGNAGMNGNVTAEFEGDVRGMASVDRRFAGLKGEYKVVVEDVILGDTGCSSAKGSAATDILVKNAALWNWQGPALAGPISCENGQFILALSGSDNLQNINAVIRVSPAGTYRAEFDVVTSDQRAGSILPLFGFEALGGNYRLIEEGRWF